VSRALCAAPRAPRFLATVLAIASTLLAGCQDFWNGLLDNPAPSGVKASDGDYANEIQVSWSAPGLSSDAWKDYEVDHYDIDWSSESDSGSDSRAWTDYSIPVSEANRAHKYEVTITSKLRLKGGAGSITGGFASDTGFALDTEDLIWQDGGSTYTIAGADRWYVTMLQRGFSYSFDFAAGTAGTGSIEFYPFQSLDMIDPAPSSATIQSWTCDKGGKAGKFYVRVLPASSGSFVARYSP
jgi:hypothetical protein